MKDFIDFICGILGIFICLCVLGVFLYLIGCLIPYILVAVGIIFIIVCICLLVGIRKGDYKINITFGDVDDDKEEDNDENK